VKLNVKIGHSDLNMVCDYTYITLQHYYKLTYNLDKWAKDNYRSGHIW